MGSRKRLRHAFAPLVAAALLAAAAAPAGAEPSWSQPNDLGSGHASDVLIDARGDVLAVWLSLAPNGTAINYAWKRPGRPWSPARELPGASQASAVLTPRGDATLAWADGGRILAADARPGRDFGNVRVVATEQPGTERPALAADDEGNLVAAWSFTECNPPENDECVGSVFAATRRAGGSWTEPRLLETAMNAGAAQVDVNAAGAAAITFLSTGAAAHVVYRHPGGSFNEVEEPPVQRYGSPSAAIDDAGRVTVSMRSLSESFLKSGPSAVAQRYPFIGWGASGTVPGTQHMYQTLLAEPDGSASWVTTENRAKVTHTVRRPDGSVEGPTTIGTDADVPDAAMNLRGDILAAWVSPISAPEGSRRLFVAERPAGAAFGQALPVSAPGGVREPQVALNDAGQAAALWGGGPSPAQAVVREDPEAGVLPFPPEVAIETPKAARLASDGALRMVVRCDRACEATPSGTLVLGGGSLFAASGSPKRLRAGRRTGVTLRLGAKRAKDVRRALKAGRRPWVGFTVRARADSPRPMTVTRRVRLR